MVGQTQFRHRCRVGLSSLVRFGIGLRWAGSGCDRFPAQPLQFRIAEVGLQPGRVFIAVWLNPNQTVVEHGLQGFPLGIEQLHLHRAAAAARTLQPQRILMVHKKAVAIEADAQPPAAIAIAQVLQRRIPDQPIQQQRLPVLTPAGGNRHEPGGIRFGLGARQFLPEVPAPLDGSPRGFDRFTPGVGGPGTEPMAAR